jgi:uncharacterized membrane protein YoaK (UPF0700 family)
VLGKHRTALVLVVAIASLAAGVILAGFFPAESPVSLAVITIGAVCGVIGEHRRKQRRTAHQ